MSKLDPDVVIDLTSAKKATIPTIAPGLLLALSDGLVLALVGWTLNHFLGADALTEPLEAAAWQRSLVTGLMLVPLVKSVVGL